MTNEEFQKLLEESMLLYVNANYSEDKREKILSLYKNPNLPSLLNYSHIHGGSGVYIDESNADKRRIKIEEDKIKKEVEKYRKEIELEIDGFDNDDIEESNGKSLMIDVVVAGDGGIDNHRHHRSSPGSVNDKKVKSSTTNMKMHDDTTIYNNKKLSDTHDDVGSLQDEDIECRDCGIKFIFTVGEQEFYASKGFDNKPKRCKLCKDEKKSHLDIDGNKVTGKGGDRSVGVNRGKGSGSSDKDRGSGNEQGVSCYFFQKGECRHGSSCRFSHEREINSTSNKSSNKLYHNKSKKSSSS